MRTEKNTNNIDNPLTVSNFPPASHINVDVASKLDVSSLMKSLSVFQSFMGSKSALESCKTRPNEGYND